MGGRISPESVDGLGRNTHKDNNLIFRYDNTPHFPGLKTFPHHKHLQDKLIDAKRPSISEVIKEVNEFLEI